MLTTTMRIRVEWSHCDPARIIFNPHYYIWMDASTHALLRHAGLDLASAIVDESFRGCPLVASGAEFHTPARLGDVLQLSTAIQKIGNTSFRVQHRFTLDSTAVCSGHEIRVWGSSDPKDPDRLIAERVPDWIRDNLAKEATIDVST